MTNDEYKIEVEKYLSELSDLVVRELRSFQNFNFHPRVKIIDAEVFHDGLGEELPIRIFLMDEGNNEVFHDDPRYFPDSSIGLLEKIEIPEWKLDFESDESWQIEIDAIFKWYFECWKKAGGDSFRLPAYICEHDDIQSLNLKTGELRMDEDDKFTHFVE